MATVEFEPGPARRRAAVGTGDAAWIEKAGRADALAARDMSVAVKEQLDAPRCGMRRNMDEENAKTLELEVECMRPIQAIIAITADDADRETDLVQRIDDGGRADIAEMPDFISLRELRRDVLRQPVMGVGEDGDAHGEGRYLVIGE